MRGVFFCLDRFAACVFACPGEFRRRFSEVEDQHTVDFTQHLGFTFCQCFRFRAFCVAQFQSVFFQFQADQVGHTAGIVAAIGLDHDTGRNDAVFHQVVGYAGKLSAVSDRILEQPFHHLVVNRLFPRVDDSLEEKVGLLKLVPEEVIVLREFEFRQVILGDDLCTYYVQSCKQPATAG